MTEAWKLDGVPEYEGGERYPTVFCGGSGLGDDVFAESGEDARVQIVYRTSEAEFRAWLAKLAAAGLAGTWSRESETGLFAEFTGPVRLYAYYVFNEKTARIAADSAGDTVADFAGPAEPSVRDDTELMQFGLYYSDMIPGVTCDCGMFYAARLRNNELILVDGGEIEQATEIAVDEAMARLRELCGGADEITVAAWFCTHPHDDHMEFFGRLLKKYRGQIRVRRAMFNFPHFAYYGWNDNSAAAVKRLRARLREYYPELKFLKLHTGMTFFLSNAEVEVILTHEDMLGLHGDKRPYEGTNETSTVLKLTFDGASVIFLGDARVSNGNSLVGRYAGSSLSCTFLQTAHHLIDRVENIYELIRTKYMLVPEGRYLILKNLRDNFWMLHQHAKDEDIFVAGDATAVFRVRNGEIVPRFYPVRGEPYDGSER